MAVKMRLARRGRKKAPFYHIVIADARAPRDGKFIEKIGSYNPTTVPATIELDRERAYDWLTKGVQPTDTVNAILKFKGILYKKHLQRGVTKGALTQEQADAKLAEFVDAKEAKVAARFDKTRQEKLDFYARLSGTAAPIKVEAATEEAQEAFREKTGEEE
jgi:small subunit ribosomal protein S16